MTAAPTDSSVGRCGKFSMADQVVAGVEAGNRAEWFRNR
jgi:hypothetical protein